MQYKEWIDQVYHQVKDIKNEGAIASYIPELANADASNFGIHISTTEALQYGVGEYQERFSIQSIGKVISLCVAYKMLGEEIWDRLGVEPSGTAFNSLVQLEYDHGIPRNPFINAGALVICDILLSHLNNPKDELMTFIRRLTPDKDIRYSGRIAESEKSAGYRNMALCHFIKSFDNINNDPNDVLDFYFDLCSIELNCAQLSELFLFLANNGRTMYNNDQILTSSQCKRINALMQTCGFYDESGEFAFKVGLPGKSGVSGGIIAIHPKAYAIAVWSPKLNDKGNSYKGMRFLEAFTTLSEQSIF